MSPDPDDTPVLITDAAQSNEDEFKTRKRRYSIMMAMRVAVPGARRGLLPHALAGGELIILSIPLPWMAVLIANDGCRFKASKFRRHREEPDAHELDSAARQLEAKSHPIIES